MTTFHKLLSSDIFDEKYADYKSFEYYILINKGLTAGIARKYRKHHIHIDHFKDRPDEEIISFSYIKNPSLVINLYNRDAVMSNNLLENKNLNIDIARKIISGHLYQFTHLHYSLYNTDNLPLDDLLNIYFHLGDYPNDESIDFSIQWNIILEKFDIKSKSDLLQKITYYKSLKWDEEFIKIMSYNAPINIIEYLIENKIELYWNFISVNKNITEEFVLKYIDKLDKDLLQSNESIPLEFIIEHFALNIKHISYRLDLTLEDMYKYGLLEYSFIYKNPCITWNMLMKHDIFRWIQVPTNILTNPSLTYENMSSEKLKKIIFESFKRISNDLLCNNFEFDYRMIKLNKILEKRKIHASGSFKILEQYLISSLCGIIIDYEFYR